MIVWPIKGDNIIECESRFKMLQDPQITIFNLRFIYPLLHWSILRPRAKRNRIVNICVII